MTFYGYLAILIALIAGYAAGRHDTRGCFITIEYPGNSDTSTETK